MIEIILSLIVIFITFMGGAVYGWNARERSAKKFVADYLKQSAEKAQANTVSIRLSREGDQFLVHDADTGEFLAQGTDHKQISSVLSDRYPTKMFVAVPDNLKEVGYTLDDTV